MNSVVLWYDIGRQGATNESMSLSPILKDLSGNGNDATCYNFGWSEMSGIGGYSTNFNNWGVNSSVQVEKNSNYFKLVDNTNNINAWLLFISGVNGVSSFSVKITNLIGNLRFQRFDGDIKTEIPIEGNGIFTIEEIEPTNHPIGFLGDVENGLTIELIPQYPNALVSDGVNDYCLVQDRYYYTDYHSSFATSLDYTKDGFRSFTINSNKVEKNNFFTYLKTVGVGVDYDYKIRITGLDEFKKTYPNAYFANQQGDEAHADGEYHWQGTTTYQHITLILFSMETLAENTPINITIEQLPLNKKSLVLNKEDGYTVIAKRKWLNPPINGEDVSHGVAFVSKRKTSDTGAFVTEFYNNASKNWMCRSFSGNIAIDGISSEDIIYQTPTSYNGQYSLSAGDWNDDDCLYIGSLINAEYCGDVALYSLLLFNRDLTDEEIEWVKTNLIEVAQ